MFRNIRGIIALLIMATLGSCSGSCTWMQPEPTRLNLNSLPLDKNTPKSIAVVTVRQRGMPLGGTKIEFSPSAVAQDTKNSWSATTDENGHARVEITPGGNVPDHYFAKAVLNGSEIGSWSSISIKNGYEVTFDFPIGEEAQITGSSLLAAGQ